MADEQEVYHIYAPQDLTAETEADRSISDDLGRRIAETYLTSANLDPIYAELQTKEDKSNKVNAIDQSSTDDKYPSAKATFDFVKNAPNVVEIAWSDLKSLRDNAQLVPGRFYRIIDYVTTTAQANTRSAGHAFDIIVVALSNDMLSEEAWALQHAGDTYFVNNRLEAWRIWYCLDNDATRFLWADATNGKGVIYRMIDEFNNDLPYDFKNIQFKTYKGDFMIEGNARYPKFINMHDYFADILEDDSLAALAQSIYDLLRAKTKNNLRNYDTSVILYSFNGYFKVSDLDDDLHDFMTDPAHGNLGDNDCIAAISSTEDYNLCYLVIDVSVDYYFYTFSDGTTAWATGAITDIIDSSISGNVHSNTFASTIGNGKHFLRSNIIFGRYTYSNIIGSEFSDNTIGSYFQCNVIGNLFYGNIISSDFRYNNVQDDFYGNIIGTDFRWNTIYSNFYHNTVGNDGNRNAIGSFFQCNVIGNYVEFNNIDTRVEFNVICSDFSYNSVGSDFKYNVIGSSATERLFVQHCKFDNGVQHISLTSNASGSYSNFIQNIHIHSGVQGTSSEYKTISVARNLPYKTNVVPVGSVTIEI